jgi:hypothetical protein
MSGNYGNFQKNGCIIFLIFITWKPILAFFGSIDYRHDTAKKCQKITTPKFICKKITLNAANTVIFNRIY